MSKVYLNATWYIVVATWLLAGIGIWSTYNANSFYEDQLVEAKKAAEEANSFYLDQLVETRKATELNWRPFLDVRHLKRNIDVSFIAVDSFSTDTTLYGLDQVSRLAMNMIRLII